MDSFTWLSIIAVAITSALALLWTAQYGVVRGLLATLLRVGWTAPILTAFFPRVEHHEIPRTLALKNIPVLLDDSESMRLGKEASGLSFAAAAESLLQDLRAECLRLGCQPHVTRLSDLAPELIQGQTPLAQGIESWSYRLGQEPWIVLSDGGEARPTLPWNSRLAKLGVDSEGHRRGLIVGFKPADTANIWLEMPEAPLFAFENKPFNLSISLRRDKAELSPESTQVQVLNNEQVLASVDAAFFKDQAELNLSIPVSSLKRGQHLLTIKVLPTSDETAIWDNTVQRVVEVMPNTVGVLHLLGAPSWDGRFLRRYLKAEPKYDLISFFILRDPGDTQQVNERELSLIPFPVDRLFNEELPNFHTVVLQDFTLFQFLEPAYQAKLVKFVQDGGGLLFLGGSRALQTADYRNTPLAEILPFTPAPSALQSADRDLAFPPFRERTVDKSGPWFDEDLSFSISLASPPAEERALANVYEDWQELAPDLAKQKGLSGLHHMENVKFKQGQYTPLLNARLDNGKTLPLAVASYPGKGRALWLFSDSLWRLAMNPSPTASRQVYSEFMRSSLNWLLRQELSKPLRIHDFQLSLRGFESTRWSFQINGPAVRHFRTDGPWLLKVCGTSLKLDDIQSEKQGAESWLFSGKLARALPSGAACLAEIEGSDVAFGSVKAALPGVLAATYTDKEIGAAPVKLAQLARLTKAQLLPAGGAERQGLWQWLAETTGQAGVALPPRIKTTRDHYWFLASSWLWLLLLFLPGEVLVRRWPDLVGARGN